MILFDPDKPTATIEHPGNEHVKPGELRVVIEQPSEAEELAYGNALQIEDKVNWDHPKNADGTYIRDAKGKLDSLERVSNIPPIKSMTEHMLRIMTDVHGLADKKDGGPLDYSKLSTAQKKEVLWFLWKPAFYVTESKTVPLTAQEIAELKKANPETTETTKVVTSETAFPRFVLNKMKEPGVFGDPLERPETTTSSSVSSSSVS